MADGLISAPANSTETGKIVDAVRAILVDELRLGVSLDSIDAEASFEELGMDSVAMIELISAVEAKFEFMFLDSDLVSSSFASVRALGEVIAKRVQVATAA